MLSYRLIVLYVVELCIGLLDTLPCVEDSCKRNRRQGRKSFKGFEPVLVKTIKGERSMFDISLLDRVEKVFMPLNLDKHWVAVKFDLVKGKIFVYDSLQTTTHVHHLIDKCAHVLLDMLMSMSYKGKEEPCPIVIAADAPEQYNG
ncbi:hypothetical protein DVH24_018760 [Malus domestica]|uniref:Ubiquitin-like protease family profile domain-containing protein n=1 Tax=Malus domestica TaxID=3750 RepID=A0A498HPD0_MALDO|nr:hypothetical protein DVH24_018760 [Malus domestica]